MPIQPTKLSLTPDQVLEIDWSDGRHDSISVRVLREGCPCATCREKRSAPPAPKNMLTVLSAAETQPLKLLGMEPLGNYAYGLQFSDGHDTGIFTFELLRNLGQSAGS